MRERRVRRSVRFSMACPHGPQGGARSAGRVHILSTWRREGRRRSLDAPWNERGVGPRGEAAPPGHGRRSFATTRGFAARHTSGPRRGAMQGLSAARTTHAGAVRWHATAPTRARARARSLREALSQKEVRSSRPSNPQAGVPPCADNPGQRNAQDGRRLGNCYSREIGARQRVQSGCAAAVRASRSPVERSVTRSTAAATLSSVPWTTTWRRARVTAV